MRAVVITAFGHMQLVPFPAGLPFFAVADLHIIGCVIIKAPGGRFPA